ncbi:MAG: hypothetical protein WHT81_09695, partial [Rectinemataceae bacterium]
EAAVHQIAGLQANTPQKGATLRMAELAISPREGRELEVSAEGTETADSALPPQGIRARIMAIKAIRDDRHHKASRVVDIPLRAELEE